MNSNNNQIPGQYRFNSNSRTKIFVTGKIFIIMLLLITVLLTLQACNTLPDNYITIATAGNVQFAMDTLVIVFEKESGIKANIILGSSGKLTAQILQGAPYDIFVSANMKYPMEVFKNGLALGEPKVYAYGSLVLWTPKEFTVSSLDILKDAEIRKIAIPNPRTAVYGEAAVELLKNKGIFEVVKDKLVYGESITQVSQFLISKAADIGFSAKSIVLSPEMRNIGSWFEVDPQGYTPIQQGVIIVNRNNNRLDQAEKFITFLLSEKAKGILTAYGYTTNIPP